MITWKYCFVKLLNFIFTICEFHNKKKLTSIKEEGVTNVLQMVYPGAIISLEATLILHIFTHAFRTYLLIMYFICISVKEIKIVCAHLENRAKGIGSSFQWGYEMECVMGISKGKPKKTTYPSTTIQLMYRALCFYFASSHI